MAAHIGVAIDGILQKKLKKVLCLRKYFAFCGPTGLLMGKW
jgi:hypothetical protein